MRDARAVMHVGIAYMRWRGKRSRHSRRMRTRKFAYLARGPYRNICSSRGNSELNRRYLGQRNDISVEMYWMTFLWSWPKVMAVALMNRKLLVCTIKSEPVIKSVHILLAITPWSCLSPEQILWEFCWKLLFWQNIYENLRCVFNGQTLC